MGWALTDLVIEPRLKATAVDGDPTELPTQEPLEAHEKRGVLAAFLAMAATALLFLLTVLSETSPWRAPAGTPLAEGQSNLLVSQAPLMQSIVPLIFVFFVVPGVVYGLAAGTVKTHRDIIAGMSKAMASSTYWWARPRRNGP